MSSSSSLPAELVQAIDEYLEGVDPSKLVSASFELTSRYRSRSSNEFMSSKLHRLAYITARLPATFAVNYKVLSRLVSSGLDVKSLVDLGAGPGTVMWAAAELWPKLEKISLIEADDELICIGNHLSKASTTSSIRNASWQQANLLNQEHFIPHDLLTLSYVWGEFPVQEQMHLLKRTWQAAGKALVLIEPGTPAGFAGIIRARTWLIQNGASIFAPCPHNVKCPLTKQDWCHFSVRLPRSKYHRRIKKANLGYEDEKYSYLIAYKEASHQTEARIIKRPIINKGYVVLDLCTAKGLGAVKISKKNKVSYLKARKAYWGDSWVSDSTSSSSEED